LIVVKTLPVSPSDETIPENSMPAESAENAPVAAESATIVIQESEKTDMGMAVETRIVVTHPPRTRSGTRGGAGTGQTTSAHLARLGARAWSFPNVVRPAAELFAETALDFEQLGDRHAGVELVPAAQQVADQIVAGFAHGRECSPAGNTFLC
jgi:hypothetical protein